MRSFLALCGLVALTMPVGGYSPVVILIGVCALLFMKKPPPKERSFWWWMILVSFLKG
jgi:hypothetical protein